MSASITIRAEGVAQVEARLAGLVRQFGDLTPLMDEIGMGLVTSTQFRFEDEQGPDGSKWKPSIRARETGGKTLTDDGFLKQITHNASATSVVVGSNLTYAAIHQFGFDGSISVPAHKRTITQAFGLKLKASKQVSVRAFDRNLNLPARPFLGLSVEDEADILEDFTKFAREAAPEIET